MGKTRAENNAYITARKMKHRFVVAFKDRPRTMAEYHKAFSNMPRFGLGQTQLLPVDDPAQIAFWNSQNKPPSRKKFLLRNGKKSPYYTSLRSGHAQSSLTTVKEKRAARKAANKKSHETRIINGTNIQQHIMEASGIKAFITECEKHNLPFLFKPVFDGLGSDLVVQHKDASDKTKWALIQFKTATHNDEGQMVSLQLKKFEINLGGIYENMCVIGIMLDFDDLKTSRICLTFDYIPKCTMKEIFLIKDISDLPGKSLYPCAWTPTSRPDKYGSSRYVSERDGVNGLSKILNQFVSIVSALPTYTLDEVYFAIGSKTPNVSISSTKRNEMMQIKILSDLFSQYGVEIDAPLRQNETTDIILRCNEWQKNVSLKTASKYHGKDDQFRFHKGEHPNHQFCDLVIAFVHQDDDILTKCYVFDSKYVYVTNKCDKIFYWRAEKEAKNLFDVNDLEFLTRLNE